VSELLQAGRLTALDRSEKTTLAAARRNEACVSAGKAEFLLSGLFHRQTARARGLAEILWLAPGGALFVFLDRPSASGASRSMQARSRTREPGSSTNADISSTTIC
jgi:hypothetical protein